MLSFGPKKKMEKKTSQHTQRNKSGGRKKGQAGVRNELDGKSKPKQRTMDLRYA